MIETAINLCKEICQFVDKQKILERESRMRISVVLDEISRIMDDTAIKLRLDEYPHGNCVILENLAENLKKHLSDSVNSDDLNKLETSLNTGLMVEKYYAMRKDTNVISEIERASGEFKSLSLLMKL
jgi:hypothetical protein